MKDKIIVNESVEFFTDAATLAIFDPLVINHRVHAHPDWWTDKFNEVEEVNQGLISLISLSNDGSYKIRVTTESLTQDEKDFAREAIGPLGFTSKSGQIFVGKGECLCGINLSTLLDKIPPHSGKLIALPPGHYDAQFYYINAESYASQKLIKSLPDVVVLISEREHSFQVMDTEPRFSTLIESFLFPSKRNANKIKPRLNQTLKAKVWNSTRTENGKAIVSDGIWPESYTGYEIVLEDMSKVKWKDKIKIKTIRLDEENKIIYAELIEKQGS